MPSAASCQVHCQGPGREAGQLGLQAASMWDASLRGSSFIYQATNLWLKFFRSECLVHQAYKLEKSLRNVSMGQERYLNSYFIKCKLGSDRSFLTADHYNIS